MSDLRVSFPKPCSEKWDDMRPEGCNRHCASCDKIIRDLSQLTFDDAEALLRSGGEVCVRAQVGYDGVVKLRPGGARRMVAALGASAGILAASAQAAPADAPKLGAIKGAVFDACGSGGSVSATAADGTIYYAKIGINGRYKVKRLPAGSYQVKVDTYSPQPTPAAADASPDVSPVQEPETHRVVVQAGRTSIADLTDPNGCIIIGMLKVEDSNG